MKLKRFQHESKLEYFHQDFWIHIQIDSIRLYFFNVSELIHECTLVDQWYELDSQSYPEMDPNCSFNIISRWSIFFSNWTFQFQSLIEENWFQENNLVKESRHDGSCSCTIDHIATISAGEIWVKWQQQRRSGSFIWELSYIRRSMTSHSGGQSEI